MESFGAIIDDKAINLMNFSFKVFYKIQNEYPNAWTNLTNPTMHLFRIPQCIIQNRNVHISVLNGALWDMEHVHYGINELGQLQ